jgi:hypothetical protein
VCISPSSCSVLCLSRILSMSRVCVVCLFHSCAASAWRSLSSSCWTLVA